ncbi:hypothetical protein J4229_00870 [Candidatus Pacearchaeota archaeon]|nr:hypothetical protein [Candidatus Pacearchaeota archaeon]
MGIVSAILSPAFLVNNIQFIALVAGVIVLVFFEDLIIKKFIFLSADFVKSKISEGVGVLYENNGIRSGWAKFIKRYVSEAFATFLVIFYCYAGSVLLGIYILEPIFQRLKSIILIIVIGLFVLTNYVINNSKIRKMLFHLDIDNRKGKK